MKFLSVKRTKTKGLSSFLRDARIETNFTQLEAAKSLGHATPQYISNFERGLCEPSLDIAVTLCELYGIPRDNLYKLMLSLYEDNLKDKLFPPKAKRRSS